MKTSEGFGGIGEVGFGDSALPGGAYSNLSARGSKQMHLPRAQALSARLRAARLLLGEFLSAWVAQEQHFHPRVKADGGDWDGDPRGQRSVQNVEAEENLPWKRHGTARS